jgi:hypothetical protein
MGNQFFARVNKVTFVMLLVVTNGITRLGDIPDRSAPIVRPSFVHPSGILRASFGHPLGILAVALFRIPGRSR